MGSNWIVPTLRKNSEEYVNVLTCSSFGTDHSSCERLSRLLRSENFSPKLDGSGHSRVLVFMIRAQKVSSGMDSCSSCTTTWLAVLPSLVHVAPPCLGSSWDHFLDKLALPKHLLKGSRCRQCFATWVFSFPSPCSIMDLLLPSLHHEGWCS